MISFPINLENNIKGAYFKTPKNVSCRIFNNDASEALQCGNGLRAIMLYLKNSYDIDKTTINISDIGYEANIQDENNIHVNR